jgi:hypothetical protein
VRAAGSISSGYGTSGRGLVEAGNLNSGAGTYGGKVSSLIQLSALHECFTESSITTFAIYEKFES